MGMLRMLRWVIGLMAVVPCVGAKEGRYEPLVVTPGERKVVALEVRDAGRSRILPVRVYLPEGRVAAPVILFSHGLGGSCQNNPYLGRHWAGRGYVVCVMQHPGSDESVWKEVAVGQRMAAMREAASLANFTLRAGDVRVVIDALERWNGESGHPLEHRMDLTHIGMAGHSFGAVTTQAVVGQVYAGAAPYLESRIDAAVMMSPSPPMLGDPTLAFAGINLPCLLMTGTRDDSPIGRQTAADRLKVYPCLNHAPAWEVVFDGATHMDFGGASEPSTRYHRAILALTTAFWDAHLKGDGMAKAWLTGDGAKAVLDAKDRWQANGLTKK